MAVVTNSTEEKSLDNTNASALSPSAMDGWSNEFVKNDKNLLAMNVTSNLGTLEAALSRNARLTHNHVYSIQLKEEGKPVTSQGSSGRCWIFAALNVMRLPFMKEQKIDTFEFSQAYMFFWDKFERCNWFLEQIIDTMSEQDIDSRLLQFLLSKPTEDGGQFDMIVNIVEKYGVVPKDAFPEIKCTEGSRRLNWIINTKLREFAKVLRLLNKENKDKKDCLDTLRIEKNKQLKHLYSIFCIHFGVPPTAIKWAFRNKDKEYAVLRADGGLDFYNKYVRKHFDTSEMVSIVNDPRNKYDANYTVSRLNNVVNGTRKEVLYVNKESNALKEYIISELKKDKPVWFGCDVGKHFYGDDGIMDLKNFDYKLTFGVNFGLTKAERLQYGVSLMTHAMVFTGVDIDEDSGKPTKWRVENSWGDKRGHKGYCLMTDEWFDEYMYQIIMPKSVLNDKDKKLYEDYEKGVESAKPTVLPPWDPMGSLAQ